MKENCPRCKHEWNYKGKKRTTDKYFQYISCPKCRTSVKLR